MMVHVENLITISPASQSTSVLLSVSICIRPISALPNVRSSTSHSSKVGLANTTANLRTKLIRPIEIQVPLSPMLLHRSLLPTHPHFLSISATSSASLYTSLRRAESTQAACDKPSQTPRLTTPLPLHLNNLKTKSQSRVLIEEQLRFDILPILLRHLCNREPAIQHQRRHGRRRRRTRQRLVDCETGLRHAPVEVRVDFVVCTALV